MYSGITQGLFPIVACEWQNDQLLRYAVELPAHLLEGLIAGCSVSIDGVCQTVVDQQGSQVFFQAMGETLSRTTLNECALGRQVSVERSLKLGDEMGGHNVYGHVIGTGTITDLSLHDGQCDLVIACDAAWMPYILEKGFIAVDGSSLTVGAVDAHAHTFALHLIPETMRLTHFGRKPVGARVNIELDHQTVTLVKTAERLLNSAQ